MRRRRRRRSGEEEEEEDEAHVGAELGVPLSGFVAVVCSFNARARAPRIFEAACELVGDAERLARPLEVGQVDLQDPRFC